MACQYPQEDKSYILILIKDQLYFFDKNGNYYPLMIEKANTYPSAILETFMKLGSGYIDHEKDAVYKGSAVYEIVNAFNDKKNYENDHRPSRHTSKSRTLKRNQSSTTLSTECSTHTIKICSYTPRMSTEISSSQKLSSLWQSLWLRAWTLI